MKLPLGAPESTSPSLGYRISDSVSENASWEAEHSTSAPMGNVAGMSAFWFQPGAATETTALGNESADGRYVGLLFYLLKKIKINK